MRIRTGFVSNSSSTAYICDACGLAEGGYDSTMSELGFVECTEGHVICEDHAPEGAQYDDDNHLLLSEYCPVCQLAQLAPHELLNYALAVLGTTHDQLLEQAKHRFGNAAAMRRWARQVINPGGSTPSGEGFIL